ncbi:hypothetical protein DSAG12_00796 [Promethearchaeum syntrophicum]|uniref:Uncharacterized protein n=1 Tax=Promethearchaeum syntrophicum TaxID=2594042 RepID=A0A5B9D7I9_9ARCH|nr:hypothetical protein [Candidatus Prometheoarchaeum syntrophicum]QEE14973.1 hypothetical protein DSAG12_00796 [Candidatus Prometheoarchaeum syntrophicum]
MPAKKPVAKKPVSERTEKIYITIPKKYVTALEIIAGDPRDKSKTIERMIDDYIEFKEKTLKRDGKFNKVIAALRGITIENSLEEQMIFIDKWVIEHPENTDLKDYWMGIKEISDEDKIAELYKSIWDKINILGKNVSDLI